MRGVYLTPSGAPVTARLLLWSSFVAMITSRTKAIESRGGARLMKQSSSMKGTTVGSIAASQDQRARAWIEAEARIESRSIAVDSLAAPERTTSLQRTLEL